ncbi:ATP-dependent zinc protease family protein [Vibrio hepatarius]|uniref:ATP-dependent zinc protease family protein n=1 Tax=Vibrio hepatarius TaxID=171383 RepID=UPI001C09DF56|nr:ATP-dependent zinc protease [Vibrio hepatarius]
MKNKMVVGWRETINLPELGIAQINAKVDTGARTSCLHTFKTKKFEKQNASWVRFWIHPRQRSTEETIICEAPIIDERLVRDSGGHEESRYVIESICSLGGQTWPIEITLTNRENMSFRMLLGRIAMRERIIVDPSKSYLIPFKE